MLWSRGTGKREAGKKQVHVEAWMSDAWALEAVLSADGTTAL